MPVNSMAPNAKFDFFGKKSRRDHDLCPHCGKHGGNIVDTGYIDWNGRRTADEHDYQCAICAGEWTIRVFLYTGYERFPGPYAAVIYIPRKANGA